MSRTIAHSGHSGGRERIPVVNMTGRKIPRKPPKGFRRVVVMRGGKRVLVELPDDLPDSVADEAAGAVVARERKLAILAGFMADARRGFHP
jgi:hypothetical protein